MRRVGRPLLALVLLAAAAGEARAQWGYGYYPGGRGGYGRWGWGGWGGGGTVQGDIARGLGYAAMGQGVYNQKTAVARSINANTAMRWNQYWYNSQLTANRAERARLARRQARDSGTSAANEARIRDNPSPADVDSGAALNAALDQVTDPRVHASALRLATAKVPGKVVRDIPFFVATEAATINLDQLTGEKGWPFAFRDPRYDAARKAFSDAVDRALAEDAEGDLSPATVQRLRQALDALRARFEAAQPADVDARNEAEDYLKTLYGMARMLERPDIDRVLAELDTIKETTLGSLLGFMHTFNLRFGVAKTPAQKAAYEAIYPQLDALRDRIVADAGLDKPGTKPAADPRGLPTHFLSAVDLGHLDGPHRVIGKPAEPKP